MSRRKGKSFEREIARYFTEWTGIKWETTRNSGRTDLKGDIYCPSIPNFPLIVECKHRSAYSVHAMLKPTKTFMRMISDVLKKWLNDLDDDSDIMIIVKNETGIWATVRRKVSSKRINKLFETRNQNIRMFSVSGITWYELSTFYTDDYAGLKFKNMEESVN